jgi:hypothetical protein
LLRAVKLEAVVSIGYSLLKTTTHMLGVPPKSSGEATQSLCHVAVNEMLGAGALFSADRPSDVGATSARRPRSGDRSGQ